MHILVKKTECAGIRYVKPNENLTAHLFVPGQRILLRETTVTETEKTWRIDIEQRSLYVLHGEGSGLRFPIINLGNKLELIVVKT